jgi:hypothetical protein
LTHFGGGQKPDAIIIVDNSSQDHTLDRAFLAGHHHTPSGNLGTSSTVRTGFTYALAHGVK